MSTKHLGWILALAGCGLTEDPADVRLLAFEAGEPELVGYASGGTIYQICVAVAERGGTLSLTGVTDGTVSPSTELPLGDTPPDETCPTEVSGSDAQGWALFRWQTLKGRATAQLRYTRGPIVQASNIVLEGAPFPGFVASLDGEVTEGEDYQQFTLRLVVADEAMTPAARVSFTLASAPTEIDVKFPQMEPLVTDATGRARIVIAPVTEPTQIYVTPATNEMLLLTEIEPPAAPSP